MRSHDALSLRNILFWLSLSVCLAWVLPAPLSSQDDPRKVKEMSPDIGRTEISIKDLPPEVRELLLKISKEKGGKGKLYWKKPKAMFAGDYYMASRSTSITTEEHLCNKGVDYFFNGEYAKAATKFEEALRLNPKNGMAIFNYALANAFQGHYDKALSEFSKYLTMEPKDAEAYYNRALVYAQKGQFDQALTDLNNALEISSKDAQAYYLRGFVYYKKGQRDKASADYQQARKLDPAFVDQAAAGKSELDTYASLLGSKKPTSEAAATPQADTVHKQQALAFARQKEYDQALSELNQAIKLDPKDVETYNNRGSIYTLKGQYDQAVEDFTKAIGLNPRHAKAYYNRGLAHFYQKRYDLAIADFNKAVELKPKDVAAYSNRGLAFFQMGRYDRAIDDFNMAIVLNPNLADAYFNKAAALERTGEAGEAREAYQGFLKYAPPEDADRIKYARQKVTQK